MRHPLAHLYRARPVPRRMTRVERIDRWLQRHQVIEGLLATLLFAALLGACAWLLLSVPQVVP